MYLPPAIGNVSLSHLPVRHGSQCTLDGGSEPGQIWVNLSDAELSSNGVGSRHADDRLQLRRVVPTPPKWGYPPVEIGVPFVN